VKQISNNVLENIGKYFVKQRLKNYFGSIFTVGCKTTFDANAYRLNVSRPLALWRNH